MSTRVPAEAHGPAGSNGESRRVADARTRAEARLRRQRDLLRPLGYTIGAAVVATAFGGDPRPSLGGRGLAVAVALVAFCAALLATVDARFARRLRPEPAVVAMGAAAVALGALQPTGETALAGGAAVWMAVARLPIRAATVVAGAVTGGAAAATAIGGSSAAAVVAGVLLCVLLGFVAYFLRQARASQDRTELLLAHLEDAREDQLRAAAAAERSRIAGELHDVLAHALSAAAIQLQGARMLAERDGAAAGLRDAVDRAGALVRDGLVHARQAVGALRGDDLPNETQLETLVASFRSDTGTDATMRVEGAPRALPADAGLALYRGAQEALTNVVRYAPDSTATVVLRYEEGRTRLTVENSVVLAVAADGGRLAGVGGGRGLSSMRERVERAGGSMDAGRTAHGWRVELVVPA